MHFLTLYRVYKTLLDSILSRRGLRSPGLLLLEPLLHVAVVHLLPLLLAAPEGAQLLALVLLTLRLPHLRIDLAPQVEDLFRVV